MSEVRIPVVSQQEFARLAEGDPDLLHRTPLIVEGYIECWPRYRNWQDLGYLRERFGHLQAFAKAPNFVTNRKAELVSVRTGFDQYLDYIERPEEARQIYADAWIEGSYDQFVSLGLPLYCGTLRLVHKADDPVFDELLPLLPEPLKAWNHALPYYYSLFNHLWLLVSLPGALTPLHIDNNGTIAIIAQLKGRKRATLYSPADLRHVRNPDVGFMDPARPDEHDFPTWRQAERWVGDLDVGQVLFVGTNWAHHVETLETSISVSYDFIDRSNLTAYAASPDWAAALGSRAKRKPEPFVDGLKGMVSRREIDELPATTVGRRLMLHILEGSFGDEPSRTEEAEARRLYALNLKRVLASEGKHSVMPL